MLYVVKKLQNKNPGQEPGFYFVAKKKTFKKAVERNRVKRIARHAFLEAVQTGDIDYKHIPHSLVFFLERDMIQESFSTVVKRFKEDLLKNK